MLFLRLIPFVIVAAVAVGCARNLADKSKSASADAPLSQLAGSEWSPENNIEGFIQFRAKGEISGHAACNQFHGTYQMEGSRLILGPLATTRKMCPPEHMQQEHAFLEALQRIDHFSATHLRLTLYDDQDAVIMTLKRNDWD